MMSGSHQGVTVPKLHRILSCAARGAQSHAGWTSLRVQPRIVAQHSLSTSLFAHQTDCVPIEIEHVEQ